MSVPIGPYAIPNVLGVPAAVSLIPGFGAGISLLTGDAINLSGPNDSVWGIFQNGAPVVVAESVVAVDYRREFAISDYPVEQGGFESYDKVKLPRDVHMRFTAGTQAARNELLASIDAIIGTTQVFDFVTPDAVYPSMTLSHEDYSRTAQRGLGLLQVEVWGLEVVQAGAAASATASPTNTPIGGGDGNNLESPTGTPAGSTPIGGGDGNTLEAPSAAPQINGGTVTTTPASLRKKCASTWRLWRRRTDSKRSSRVFSNRVPVNPPH